jgi:hypothetical protein
VTAALQRRPLLIAMQPLVVIQSLRQLVAMQSVRQMPSWLTAFAKPHCSEDPLRRQSECTKIMLLKLEH